MRSWRSPSPWCRAKTADTGEVDPSPPTLKPPTRAVRVLCSFLRWPSELRGQCDTECARLNDGDLAVQSWCPAGDVVGNAARIAQILGVERHAIVIVFETYTRTESIIAGQALLRECGWVAAEIGFAGADIAPSGAEKILVVRERGQIVFAVERCAVFWRVRQGVAGGAAERRRGRGRFCRRGGSRPSQRPAVHRAINQRPSRALR